MGNENPGYWAVLPATVRYDKRLTANAKLLYAEISALAQATGYCWASNQSLADLFGVDKKTISRLISKLAECGYIRVEVERSEAGQVTMRKVYAGLYTVTPREENTEPEGDTPSPQNCGDPSPQCGDPSPQNYGDPSPQNCGVFNRKNNKSNEHNPLPPKHKYPEDVRKVMREYCGNDAELAKALEAFLDNRIAKKKPLKTERAAKILVNKLDRLSGGDRALKILLLDTALLHDWDSVYPLKDGDAAQAAPSAPLRGEGVRYL